jgi:hypothetical protein
VASSCYTRASYRAPCPGMVSIANTELTKRTGQKHETKIKPTAHQNN